MSTSDPAGHAPSLESLEATLDVTYTWGYQDSRKDLRDLYTRATKSQWIAEAALDWSIDVDPEARAFPEFMHPLFGSELYAKLTPAEHTKLLPELNSWILSQFLHGEQGALLAASQLVTSMQIYEGKLYAGTQVVDEARHVDVYRRYLDDKIGFKYPVNPSLKELLDLILLDSRWDIKLLGMQIMVEGLALAAFAMMRNHATEPLIVDITKYIMRDEARHVAFGVISLADFYEDVPEKERAEREDFVYEAARLMRDRFLFGQVWEKMGYPVKQCEEIALRNESQKMFRQLLFSKIVPAIKRVGLLSDRQRERFQELGILQFEDAADPFAELEASQEDAAEPLPAS